MSNNSYRIETVYFLNTPIPKLYKEIEFSTRLYSSLLQLKVENMDELKDCINNNDPRLEIFGGKSRTEVNDMFFRARVPLKENW